MNQWSKILLCALFLVYSHAALALRVNAFEKQVNTFLQRADHSSEGDKWAVLVAGSNGWWNYRHQADVCHAYQIIKSKGFPDSRIIVMRYDDIAYNMQNPLQGLSCWIFSYLLPFLTSIPSFRCGIEQGKLYTYEENRFGKLGYKAGMQCQYAMR